MRVRYLVGLRKGEIVDMPTAHAKLAIAERRVEPETPAFVEFSEETKTILHGSDTVASEEDAPQPRRRRT